MTGKIPVLDHFEHLLIFSAFMLLLYPIFISKKAKKKKKGKFEQNNTKIVFLRNIVCKIDWSLTHFLTFLI